MTAKTWVCRGSGEIGAARQDAVGWCQYCKKLQRARPGTGRLMTHWTTVEAYAKEVEA